MSKAIAAGLREGDPPANALIAEMRLIHALRANLTQ